MSESTFSSSLQKSSLPKLKIRIHLAGFHQDDTVAFLSPNASHTAVTNQISQFNDEPTEDFLFLGAQEAILGQTRLCPEPLDAQSYDIFTFIPLKEYFPLFGYCSRLLSDEQGYIQDRVAVRFSERLLQFIRVRFPYNTVATDFQIYVKDRYRQLITSYEIQNNQQMELTLTYHEKQRVHFIELYVSRIQRAHYPFRLLELSGNLVCALEENDIGSFQYQVVKGSNSSASLGGVFSSSVSFSFFDEARQFDFFNSASPYFGLLKKNKIVEVILYYKRRNHSLGVFYTDNFRIQKDKLLVKVTGKDIFNFLQGVEYTAPLIANEFSQETHTYASIVRQILSGVGIRRVLVDRFLQQIHPQFHTFSGTAARQLANLADLTDTFFQYSSSLKGIIAQTRWSLIRMQNHQVTHFFTLAEYGISSTENTTQATINRVIVEYNQIDLKRPQITANRTTMNYRPNRRDGCEGIPVLEYQEQWFSIPQEEYQAGVYLNEDGTYTCLEPSLTLRYPKPVTYTQLELTDAYIRGQFEYLLTEEIVEDTTQLVLQLWLFDKSRYGEDYDEVVFENGRYYYLQEENGVWIPDYTAEADSDFDKDKGDVLSVFVYHTDPDPYPLLIERRVSVPSQYLHHHPLLEDPQGDYQVINQHNLPYEFEMQVNHAQITSVRIYNRIIENKFYFLYEKTSNGIKVKVWNYLPGVQTLQVKIFGLQLDTTTHRSSTTVEDGFNLALEGPAEKKVFSPLISNHSQAQQKAQDLLYFYRNYGEVFTVEVFPILSLKVGDIVGFEGVLSPNFMGMIQEIQLLWSAKQLKQKLTVITLRRPNRMLFCWGSTGFQEGYLGH